MNASAASAPHPTLTQLLVLFRFPVKVFEFIVALPKRDDYAIPKPQSIARLGSKPCLILRRRSIFRAAIPGRS